jgi:hypothetical protein
MNWKIRCSLAVAAAIVCAAASAFAADHIDSPGPLAEPTADITDLYAWMNADTTKINLVMNVNPFAGADAAFSDSVVYAIHVNSADAFGAPPEAQTVVLCRFADASTIECWAGDEYVTGDPSDAAGIASESGKMRVFAGLRNDPFFMEFTGFTAAVAAVVGVAPDLEFDESRCPTVNQETSDFVIGLLRGGEAGPMDTFAGSNVLSIVVQLDKDVVAGGGSILSIWGSTHAYGD